MGVKVATRKSESQKIELRDALGACLEGKPRAVAQAVAIRAALRVFPLVGGGAAAKLDTPLRIRLLLKASRCTLVSSVATVGNATEHNRRGYAFDDNDDSAAAFVVARPHFDAAFSALAVAMAFADGNDSAVAAFYAVSAVAAAAAADPDSIWTAVEADCQLLDAGKSADEVMRLPIWHGAPPDWARAAWRDVTESQELLDAGFTPWLRWYEAAAAFDAPSAQDYFGPELSRKIALQPNEWWERGAEAVNTDIAEWLV
ncbi:MAG TPA: hypothetical protein PKZ97_15895 [Azospirillaceae bacterium]|nr:hypothetical protein [Azospirillaceae bacterium]HRQ82594.1 hypothetical protein [Azospirillaceae bacterium]